MAALHLHRLLLFFFTVSAAAAIGAAKNTTKVPSPASTSSSSSKAFIRKSCGATRYPDVCYTSLLPYASAIQQNPLYLARSATTVALSRLRATRKSILTLSTVDARAAKALKDCAGALRNAADQTKLSEAELRKIVAGKLTPKMVAWKLANAQTWMSGALTNEDTCIDGFQGVKANSGGAATATAVARRVALAKQLSSNALALINKVAS